MAHRRVECWLPVSGYEGLYEVSDLGRVKSFHRRAPAILTGGTDKDGYPIVALWKDAR